MFGQGDFSYGCNQIFQSHSYRPYYSQDQSQNELIAIVNQRNNDEQFLRNFVTSEELVSCRKTAPIKISQVKDTLHSVAVLNAKLKHHIEELKNKQLSENEWNEKKKVCDQTKEELSWKMQFLEDTNLTMSLNKGLEKRRKKRLREKRAKEQWKRTKCEMKERRIRSHNEADSWIKSKQDVIDKEKQEESLRKEADLVLFDVRGKRNDAKKYSTLLKEIEHLRKVRASIANARGDSVPAAADQAFNNIIGKLLQHWSKLDREYSLEEQGLKLMIKTDNELKKEKQRGDPYKYWETAMFGKKIPINFFAQGDINNFIAMRCAWDKFINMNEGTPIPIGWVMPNEPSSSAWQKCLKKE